MLYVSNNSCACIAGPKASNLMSDMDMCDYPCTINITFNVWLLIIYASNNQCAWNVGPKAWNLTSDTCTYPCIWNTAPKVLDLIIYSSTNPCAWNDETKAQNLMSDILTYPCTMNTTLKVWNMIVYWSTHVPEMPGRKPGMWCQRCLLFHVYGKLLSKNWYLIFYASTKPCALNARPKARNQNLMSEIFTYPFTMTTTLKVRNIIVYVSTIPSAWNCGPKVSDQIWIY